MKRIITKLVSILLVLVICFSTLPTKALAWGKMTHVYTANNIIQSSLGGGTVQYEDSSYGFSVPAEYLQSSLLRS